MLVFTVPRREHSLITAVCLSAGVDASTDGSAVQWGRLSALWSCGSGGVAFRPARLLHRPGRADVSVWRARTARGVEFLWALSFRCGIDPLVTCIAVVSVGRRGGGSCALVSVALLSRSRSPALLPLLCWGGYCAPSKSAPLLFHLSPAWDFFCPASLDLCTERAP